MAVEVQAGDAVTVSYRSAIGVPRRMELETTVTEVMGNIVYLANPYEDEMDDEVSLVLDPENYLWARDARGRDGLFGSLARLD